ncbi:MAG: branched-chain amino acid ABC transporter permease [Spirochaetales bacterium]|nr:branched-chain amino acid ABC transporter permease [Spirochaetales bacterium]MBR6348199.1 branched-chain amino acid ABC transporter permease [Spirochaetales bacterium]
MEKLSKGFRLRTPFRYIINTALTVVLWAVLTAIISGAGMKGEYYRGILITVGINIILATSLNIVCGYLGQLPLGHAGFMAVGAYAGGIFMKATPAAALLRAGNHAAVIPYIILAVLISAAVAGLFGLLIGIPALRLKGDYLAIITLGFGEIIRVVLTNIDSVLGFKFTYGASGLARIPKFTSLNVSFIFTALCLFLIHVFMKSRHGRAVLSIRDNEIAAESVGVNTTFYKTTAFVFSAMLAGIAGCLYAGYIGSLYPSNFKFMKSIEILVMVVLGGMGSMLGSVISAVVLTILPEMLRSFSDYRMVVYSLALVLMMIFRPKGLMGTYDFSMGASIEAAAARIRGLFGRRKGDGPEVDGPAGDVPAPEGADNASDKEAGR